MELAELKNLKKNRKQIDNTTYPSSALSTPSYSYDRLNENTDSNTTIVLPPNFDTYIQPQWNSASDSSVVANDVLSYGFDQRTNPHGNTDVKENDDSQSYGTPKRKLPFLLFWWYNLHHKSTAIVHTASTWK